MKSHEAKQNYTLGSGLAELRSEYNTEPPSRVEDALLARFRELNRRRSRRKWALASVAAAAAALLLLLHRGTVRKLPRPVPSALTLVHAPTSPLAKPVEVVVQAQPPVALRPHRLHRRSVDGALAAASQGAEFLAIPYSEPLSSADQVDVYRVRMPRVALARFGLPIAPGTLDSAVTADVAVGRDGVARAIRFVR